MRALLDTNIVLDLLLKREPFAQDAVQLAGALAYRLDAIVTRDPQDFAGATLPVHSPADFLKQFSP